MSWSDWWSGFLTAVPISLLACYAGLVYWINTSGKCYTSFCIIPRAIGIQLN